MIPVPFCSRKDFTASIIPISTGRQSKLAIQATSLLLCLIIILSDSPALYAQATKRWVPTNGGAWTTAANWSPSGVPAANDHVIIPASQSQPITAIPKMAIGKLIIRGNCQLEASSANSLLTVNDSFFVAAGATVNFGVTSSKFSLTLSTTSVGKVEGVFVQNTSTPSGVFTSSGDLDIEPSAYISGTGSFVLSAGARLRIGAASGILAGTLNNGNVRVSGGRTFNVAAHYVYDGTSDQTIGDGLPTGLTGSLTIDNSNSVLLTVSRTLTSGNLNLLKGVFAAGNLFSVGTNTTTTAVTINRSEGFMTGALQGANWYSVNYSGDNKNMSAETSGTGLRNVQVNLDANKVLTLQGNLTIPNILTLTRGNIATGIYSVVMNGTIYGGSAASYVIGHLQLPIAAGASLNFFPLGSNSGYAPVNINYGAGTPSGTFVASTTEGDPTSIENSSLNVYRTVNRSWSLEPGNTLATAAFTASLEWNSNNADPDFDYAIAVAGKYANTSWTYPSISTRTANTVQIANLSGAGVYTLGKECTYTAITKQPIGGAICSTASIELSTDGTGDGKINFQWLKDGENIADAISNTLTVSAAGTYSVVVAGECQAVTSNVALVSIKPTTVIKAAPVGGMKCAGDEINIAAEGSGDLLYQWRRNDQDIEGATASTFAVFEAGNYTVSVVGECGTAISSVAEINMHAPTAVTLQPADKEITYGESVNFSVEAAGTGDLTYKWKVQNGNNWVDVAEENVLNAPSTSLFSLATPSAAISGTIYKCVVTGFCGDAVSNEVNLIIRKVPLTITASDHVRTYGDPNPDFAYTYTGFVNGEDWETSGITGAPGFVTPAEPTTGVGDYDIMPETGTMVSANYSFDFVKGKLTIEQAPLTVSAVKIIRPYGDPNPDFNVDYIGLKNNETVQTCDVTGTPVFSTDATALSGIGTYDVLVEPGDVASLNYAISFQNSTLEIEKAILRVKPDDFNIVYGDTIPDLSFTIEGYKNGEDAATAITGGPVLSTLAVDGSDAGEYSIDLAEGDLGAGNYSFDLKPGKLTIAKANLDVIANNASRTYGDPNPGYTYTMVGFVSGQTLATSGVTGTPVLTTTVDNFSPAGTYAITVSKGDLSAVNYQFTYHDAILTVNKATLTLKATDKLKIYGEPNPPFDVTYNGFKNNEELASSGVTGSPSFNTNATVASSVGSYNINPGTGTLLSGNYQFSFSGGKLFVAKATLTMRADTMRRDFGKGNPVFTYKFSGFKNGETLANSGVTGTPLLTTTATASSLSGKYPINATAGTLAANNYNFEVYGGQLLVDLRLTATSTNPICPTVGEGVINLTATGSPGVVEYSVDGGNTYSSSPTINQLVMGTYTIKARDDQGNISRDSSVALKVDVVKWVGSASGNPTSRKAWENVNNWNGGKTPSATSHVIIPNVSGLVVDINSNVQVASIQIGAGASVNVLNTYKLTTTGKCPVLPAQ